MSDYLQKLENHKQHLDVIREIGNIGSGNAVTALSTMLDKKIDMSVPEVEIVPFKKIMDLLDGPETVVVGVLVDFSGDLNGYILLILGMKDAYEMASIALGQSVQQQPDPEDPGSMPMSEMEFSAITEIANILIGAYLSAICSLTQLSVVPSIPQVAIDMIAAFMNIVALEYGKVGDSAIFLKTQFSEDSKNINGHFFLVPDLESYKVLMNSLGLDA